MIENWEFCNSTGVTRMIGFKAGLFNCRVAAYCAPTMAVHQQGVSPWSENVTTP